MPTHCEYAKMSNAVYNDEGKPAPDGWNTVYYHNPSNEWGFAACIYKNRASNECVVAFRGTVPTNIGNVISDMGLIFGQIPAGTFNNTFIARYLNKERSGVLGILANIFYWTREKLTGQKNISYTGHSLGGTIAEIRACMEKVKAVTFDSTGCRSLLSDKEQIDFGEKNIICYLTAPHPINTLHGHLGKIIRLYIKSDSFSTQKVLQEVYRTANDTFRFVIFSIFLQSTLKYKLDAYCVIKFINANFKRIMSLCRISFVSAATLRYAFWLSYQHSIDNIIDCFDPINGQPRADRMKEIKRWPSRYEYLRSGGSECIFSFFTQPPSQLTTDILKNSFPCEFFISAKL